MRFSDEFLDEVKSRVRLSDLIGRTVKLRRQGREFAGLSPFTKEKSPSFFVNDDKGFYHCFSSGKHGDAIAFLMEVERLPFHEAVERLADEAGMELPKADQRSAEEERRRLGLMDWLHLAQLWFEGELRRPGGDAARQYLERRGLNAGDWQAHHIGFAPDSRTGLKDYLIAKGARPAELVDAGLLIVPEDGGAPYDRFRGRIIFPITDQRGRITSFGGRALDPQARAKYLNGPDTPLFDKGRTLYGLWEARKIAAQDATAPLVVVEGYMDVIACHHALVPAVAPMGTALTDNQLDLLWRFCPEPTLCFDADAAGQRAVARAIERALPMLRPGRTLKFAIVSGGKDPDDIWREQGPAALRAMMLETKSLADALFEHEWRATNMDSPDERAALRGRLRAAARTIGSADLSREYQDHLDGRFKRLVGRGDAPQRFAVPPPSGLPPVAAALVKAVIADPDRLEAVIEWADRASFGNQALDGVMREATSWLFSPTETLFARLMEKGYGAILNQIDLSPDTYADREPWTEAMRLITDYAVLDSAVQSAKASLSTAADIAAFTDLKTRRDAAKKALPR